MLHTGTNGSISWSKRLIDVDDWTGGVKDTTWSPLSSRHRSSSMAWGMCVGWLLAACKGSHYWPSAHNCLSERALCGLGCSLGLKSPWPLQGASHCKLKTDHFIKITITWEVLWQCSMTVQNVVSMQCRMGLPLMSRMQLRFSLCSGIRTRHWFLVYTLFIGLLVPSSADAVLCLAPLAQSSEVL